MHVCGYEEDTAALSVRFSVGIDRDVQHQDTMGDPEEFVETLADPFRPEDREAGLSDSGDRSHNHPILCPEVVAAMEISAYWEKRTS